MSMPVGVFDVFVVLLIFYGFEFGAYASCFLFVRISHFSRCSWINEPNDGKVKTRRSLRRSGGHGCLHVCLPCFRTLFVRAFFSIFCCTFCIRFASGHAGGFTRQTTEK